MAKSKGIQVSIMPKIQTFSSKKNAHASVQTYVKMDNDDIKHAAWALLEKRSYN